MIKRFVATFSVIFLSVLVLVFAVGFTAATPAFAQTQSSSIDVGLTQFGQQTGLPATDIRIVVAKIIRAALGLLGIVAVVIVLYGGFRWMTAGGNEEQVAESKKILFNGLIGLLIIFSAFAITQFVLGRLTEATGSGNLGDNGAGGGGGGGFGGAGDNLYVSSLPPSGQMCARNVHPTVVFTKEVSTSTFDGAMEVRNAGGQAVDGNWYYVDGDKTTVAFAPNGSCDQGTINDCLLPNTSYTFVITHPEKIKSLNGLTLQCNTIKPCGPVQFTSGDAVDRNPPTVSFGPLITPLVAGAATPVSVTLNVSDDTGLQQVLLKNGSTVIGSQSFAGCKKQDTVTIPWPVQNLNAGDYTLLAKAFDSAAQTGSATKNVTLVPGHCVDNVLDPGEIKVGPPACGGECGACGGTTCTDNNQCASGYCAITPPATSGVCVDRMRITNTSPASGAPGTYVTVQGYFFGSTPGHVYFASAANADSSRPGDWIEAQLVACSGSFNSWTGGQVIVEVPKGAVTGPIMVVTATTTVNGVKQQFKDTTRDEGLHDFQVTSEVRPGLCGINPINYGYAGDQVTLVGKNFGSLNNPTDAVLFSDQKAQVDPLTWFESAIPAIVPNTPRSGAIQVKVVNDGMESNAIAYTMLEGGNTSIPIVTGISPNAGPAGEYVTVSGKNFGTTPGVVWLKPVGTQSGGVIADREFPPLCEATTWSDDKILIKIPKNLENNGKYVVQVVKGDVNKATSDLNSAPVLAALDGQPTPGICFMSPAAGIVPFAKGEVLTIAGEYFGDHPNVYFWKAGASSTTVNGRTAAEQDGFAVSGNTINARPPADTITGPVVVYRAEDGAISNGLPFNVADCTKNKPANTCNQAGYNCCISGGQTGMCVAPGQLCQGQTRNASYVWEFSTRDIIPVPRVVERCDASVGKGLNLPSPSPSVQWDNGASGDSYNVCSTALATVEFTTAMKQSTVDASSVLINRCDSVQGNRCINPHQVTIDPASFTLQTSGANGTNNYLQLRPTGQQENSYQWANSTWYQVILKKSIQSAGTTSSLQLAADKPCDSGDPSSADSAYCFVFKTDQRACKLNQVIVTPTHYTTSLLDSFINYRATGLSDQRCIMMDVSGYNWDWDTSDHAYATIYKKVENSQTQQVQALANTVGVGLDNDSVQVSARAITTTAQGIADEKENSSPLTIDLSNPQVVDHWPSCLEACTNAQVGVRFNVSMSNRNITDQITPSSVQLLKCDDANCQNPIPANAELTINFDPSSKNTVLNIANASDNAAALEPNTLYEVVISASTTDLKSPDLVWSAARSSDFSSYSKPLNTQFTWRFKTKQNSCAIDHVQVTPGEYVAAAYNDRTVFQAQPYGAPDQCSPDGQKLNPWKEDWNWHSSDNQVATVQSFPNKGSNSFCTAMCTLKGSTIPSGTSVLAICGNGKLEAGEDCDPPDGKNNCGLDCRFITNRHTGSSSNPDSADVHASICGDGKVTANEDCDTAIPADINNPQSSLNCSAQCLHIGTPLAKSWCVNDAANSNFTKDQTDTACVNAISQCGDGITSPDEDKGCDLGGGKHADFCNDRCLSAKECTPGTEGCGADGMLLGSSLKYTNASVCGDGMTGTGEASICETSVQQPGSNLTDPWALAQGVGMSTNVTGNPAAMVSTISATTKQNTQNNAGVSGNGSFKIMCGYKTDEECEKLHGGDLNWGVGADSCCYMRPTLAGVTPATSTPVAKNICPNTVIEARFNGIIDPSTVQGNVLVAQGGNSNPSAPLSINHSGTFAGGPDYIEESPVVVGDYIFALLDSNPAGLESFHIKSDGTLEKAGRIATDSSGQSKRLVIKGSYAYLSVNNTSNKTDGLRVIDIHDPKNLTEAGRVDAASVSQVQLSYLYDMEMAGNYLYILDGSRMAVFDIGTDPKQPKFLSNVSLNNTANIFSVAVDPDQKYAYVGLSDGSIKILDVTSPATPKLVNTFTSPSITDPIFEKIISQNGYLYVVSDKVLHVLSIADPTQPVWTGSVRIGVQPQDTRVIGNYVFMAGGYPDGKLYAIDATQKSSPVIRNVISNHDGGAYLSGPTGVVTKGNYLYVTNFDGTFELMDIKDIFAGANNACVQDITSLLAVNSGVVHWYEKLWIAAKQFIARLFGADANANIYAHPSSWCTTSEIATAQVIYDTTSTSRIVVSLKDPLSANTNYAIVLKDAIKDMRGVSIGKDTSGFALNWKFNTAQNICLIDSLKVSPDQVVFQRANSTTTLEANVYTSSGQEIQPIPDFYNWVYQWGPSDSQVVGVENTTSSRAVITAQNHIGEEDVHASAIVTKGVADSSGKTVTGNAATGKSHVMVILCENPWPHKEITVGSDTVQIFPFEDTVGNHDGYSPVTGGFDGSAIPASQLDPKIVGDGYFNFSTYYCADNGSSGTADDFPYLHSAVQSTNNIVSNDGALKRFIFTADNGDAIGIQVFANPKHLTPEEWYSSPTSTGGQGFVGNLQALQIDGNDAVSDGSNVYVDAVNYASNAKTIYSNIYLFSINSDAQKETRQVFEKMLKNLKFNVNLNNYAYCGVDINHPDFSTVCASDLDCANGQVCGNQIDKLKRDYTRYKDFRTIEGLLTNFANTTGKGRYPDLKEGTFLSGQVVSTWPSWSVLGNAVGKSLPQDPLNKLVAAGTCTDDRNKLCTDSSQCATGTCDIYDQGNNTNWGGNERQFNFACTTSSYAYRYSFTTSTGEFTLRAKFEDIGNPSNLSDFVNGFGFNDLSHLVMSYSGTGICTQSDEIASMSQGSCGDGVVNLNLGEECDPKGTTVYDNSACVVDPNTNAVSGTVSSKTCQADCKWGPSTQVSCQDFLKPYCGNNKIDPGEVCDEGDPKKGGFNGKYNHCSIDCTSLHSSAGWCGDGTKQAAEVCDWSQGLQSKPGQCVGGINDGKGCSQSSDCLNDGAGSTSLAPAQCVLFNNTKVEYAIDQRSSCNFDCQSYGPYCGDGIVESQFGEECDPNDTSPTDLTCNVNGIAGKRLCTNKCKFNDTAMAWWRFNDEVQTNVAHQGVYGSFADSVGANTIICGGIYCPAFTQSGKIGGAVTFDPTKHQYLSNQTGSAALMPTSSISVEAWINVADPASNYQRILEKGGYDIGGGYALQFWGTSGKVEFAVFSAEKHGYLAVVSKDPIQANTWTHVVGTYERQGNISLIKIYVKGVDVSGAAYADRDSYAGPEQIASNVYQTSTVYLASTDKPLIIGANGNFSGYYFGGSLDELRIYDRALTDDEVKDHAGSTNGSVCQIAASAPQLAIAGSCGDGHVDAGEICDNGIANGKVCSTSYNKSCSYCAADCKNIIDVKPAQFCGDGIIEGPEACDFTGGTVLDSSIPAPPQVTLYSATSTPTSTLLALDQTHNGYQVLKCEDELQEPSSLKKGAKACVNSCQTLQSSCIKCGVDNANGVKVEGGIINVLNTLSSNPFSYIPSANTFIELALGPWLNTATRVLSTQHVSHSHYQFYTENETLNQAEMNGDFASLSSNAICSQQDNSSYQIFFNTHSSIDDDNYGANPLGTSRAGVDFTHAFAFPIISDPSNLKPWKYNLLLSPVITKSQRPNDVRLVVSWNKGDFKSGLVIAGAQGVASPLEGATFPQISGFDYFSHPDQAIGGTWYHGFASVTSTFEETFTIDTSAMATSTYIFYVHKEDPTQTIAQLMRSSNLKIDVYMPENDTDPNHFAKPSKTITFANAAASENKDAEYWEALVVKSSDIESDVTKRAASVMVTNPADPNNPTENNDGIIVTGLSDIR